MKYLLFFILCISLIIFTSCTGASDRGFDANRNSEHRSQTNFLPDYNPADIDSTSIRPKPENSPNTAPTDDDEEEILDLKWI